jgi:hypothetical protein
MTLKAAARIALLLSGAAFGCTAQAQSYVLDFGSAAGNVPAACANGSGGTKTCSTYNKLLQSYGDVAGVVDVTTHRSRGGALSWFNTGYNDLYGVAFDDTPSLNQPSWIDLVPQAEGAAVTLTHFDLGGYFHSQRRNIEVDIFALGSDAALYSYRGNIGTPGSASATGQHSSFDLNLSSTSGLRIQWRDPSNAANTGIDNIAFSVGTPTAAPVPEPSTYALMLAGLGCVGSIARRRRGR